MIKAAMMRKAAPHPAACRGVSRPEGGAPPVIGGPRSNGATCDGAVVSPLYKECSRGHAPLPPENDVGRSHDRSIDATDLLTAAAGAVIGLALGYVAGGSIGRVNSRRIKSAVQRWRQRRARPAVWTHELAERLEARVLDALGRDVVLARRPIRVSVLGMGLVELTGTVHHTPEIGVASDIVENVAGVETVLNHLVVEPLRPVSPASGPNAPRAARG